MSVENTNVGVAFPFSFENGRVQTSGGRYDTPPTWEEWAVSVRHGIIQIIMTDPLSRAMLGQFGVGALSYVFLPLQKALVSPLLQKISEQISWWAKRVIMVSLSPQISAKQGLLILDLGLVSSENSFEGVQRIPVRVQ